MLDIATGTGWSARHAPSFGAKVTAIDISTDLIDAARGLWTGVEPPIDCQVGDARTCPSRMNTSTRCSRLPAWTLPP
ncbi:class I SAM-dependent methyltransferase [Sinorhizobium sp. 8-89]|uniref:class I SAM-dependent methyltransferase n=1 Tax=Sinorhizobium sp. 8-89 TaxID=3049089 RepID=UPI003864CAE6